MSSMRNAVQRRNHRERGQPEERQKWGLLEKHKDYSARARDFNQKKTKLKALKTKVSEKNPDEFYFGMMKSRTNGINRKTGTVNGDRGNSVLSQDASRLYKTQDLGYVRTARNKAAKDVEDLERRVAGITSEGRKIVFVDNQEEQLEKLEADIEMEDEEEDLITKKLRKMKEKEANKLENRLTIARQRLETLTEAEEALDLQRAKMSNSVGGVNKQGIKFKVRERKK